jgi:DNA-binding transcriptional LysR family regulator
MQVGSALFADRIAAARDPEDLANLPFVANLALKQPLQWIFSHGDRDECSVRMQATIAIDSTPAVLAAVERGTGLSILPDFLVRDLIISGHLVHVLPQWHLPSGGIHVVYPPARFRPAKVTAFLVMLIEAEKKRNLPAALHSSPEAISRLLGRPAIARVRSRRRR